MNFRMLYALVIVIFTACSSVPQKKYAQLAFGDHEFRSQYPTIFVHGLALTGTYWSDSAILKQLKEFGWTYGGDLRMNQKDQLVPADMYTVTFTTSELAIMQQGDELAQFIARVKELRGVEKVNLFGHSMGGLASREYLQSSRYRNDVQTYISIGTPHLGTNYKPDRTLFKLFPEDIRIFVSGVDFKSDAARDLRPDSIYLNGGNESDSPDGYLSKDINQNGVVGDKIIGLNDLCRRPLPEDVKYLSIIGAGDSWLLATSQQNKQSDGLVEIESQDLANVPHVNVPVLSLLSQETHLFQADDVWVMLQAIRLLRTMQNAPADAQCLSRDESNTL